MRARTPSSHFTIHGLWSNFGDSKRPQFCDASYKFDAAELDGLEGGMEKEWPSFVGTDADLWEHQWSKHGTCALDVLPSQRSYFKTVLALHAQYDLQAALAAARILPSRTASYRTADLERAVRELYSAQPQLHCSEGALSEVRMCLDKALRPFDCPAPSPARLQVQGLQGGLRAQEPDTRCGERLALPPLRLQRTGTAGGGEEGADGAQHPDALAASQAAAALASAAGGRGADPVQLPVPGLSLSLAGEDLGATDGGPGAAGGGSGSDGEVRGEYVEWMPLDALDERDYRDGAAQEGVGEGDGGQLVEGQAAAAAAADELLVALQAATVRERRAAARHKSGQGSQRRRETPQGQRALGGRPPAAAAGALHSSGLQTEAQRPVVPGWLALAQLACVGVLALALAVLAGVALTGALQLSQSVQEVSSCQEEQGLAAPLLHDSGNVSGSWSDSDLEEGAGEGPTGTAATDSSHASVH